MSIFNRPCHNDYMKPKTRALVELNTASLLFACNPILVKLITMPAFLIMFWRSVFAAILLLGYFAIKKQKLLLNKKQDYVMMFAIGALLCAHWVTVFHAVQISTVAVGWISLFTYPLMSVFLEAVFLKEKVHVSDVIAACAALVGIILIVPEFDLGNNMTQGALFGLLSALCFALRNVLSRKYVRQYPSSTVMWYQIVVVALVLLPWSAPLDISGNNIWYLLFMVIFTTAIAHTCYVKSLKELKAGTVGILASVQPIYGILFAVFLLQEIPPSRVFLGGMIILSTVIIKTFFESRE